MNKIDEDVKIEDGQGQGPRATSQFAKRCAEEVSAKYKTDKNPLIPAKAGTHVFIQPQKSLKKPGSPLSRG